MHSSPWGAKRNLVHLCFDDAFEIVVGVHERLPVEYYVYTIQNFFSPNIAKKVDLIGWNMVKVSGWPIHLINFYVLFSMICVLSLRVCS